VWYISWKATSPSAEDRLTVSQRGVEEGFRLQRHQNESARGAQPSQSDRDEPANRSLGRKAAGCCESVEAVARELVRRDIVPEVAGLCGLGQQVSDHIAKLLVRSGDLLTSMQDRRDNDEHRHENPEPEFLAPAIVVIVTVPRSWARAGERAMECRSDGCAGTSVSFLLAPLCE
jgi:hypothetical protein